MASSLKSTPDFQQLLLSNTDKLLVTYNDENYDLTEFIPLHPGGKDVFEDFLHKEGGPKVTDPKEFGKRFDEIGHSKKAMKTLNEYKTSTEEKKEKRFERQVTLDYVYKKLVTKEDPMFFHKLFGFLSICSYIYRYLYILPVTGNLGFTENNLFNYVTIAIHMILSSSSLIFHVLDRRIVSKAIIIWKEYQLHAIMFTLKSVVTCIIGMNYNLILQFLGTLCGKACNESCREPCAIAQAKLILPFIITSHLFVVDEITRLYGTPGVTTIRNEGDKDASHIKFVSILGIKINPMTYIRYFFSFYQFCGAGSLILYSLYLLACLFCHTHSLISNRFTPFGNKSKSRRLRL